MSTLREVIHENVREGELYEKLDRNWVRCFACGHCCKIPDGQPSYLHGHSALSRASFRQSGGKGLLSDTTLIPDKVLSIYLCDVRPASRGIASRRMGLWGPRPRNRGQHSMVTRPRR